MKSSAVLAGCNDVAQELESTKGGAYDCIRVYCALLEKWCLVRPDAGLAGYKVVPRDPDKPPGVEKRDDAGGPRDRIYACCWGRIGGWRREQLCRVGAKECELDEGLCGQFQHKRALIVDLYAGTLSVS